MSPSIRKLTGRIGVLVKGVDLAACPDPSTIRTLRHALNEHKVIVFDDVNLAGQEHMAGWFGGPTTAHPNGSAADGTRNRSDPLVGDASHYSSVLEVAA
ncbi:hypothetical protein ACWCP6_19765 [Streptomyces sp. NPDC002004]